MLGWNTVVSVGVLAFVVGCGDDDDSPAIDAGLNDIDAASNIDAAPGKLDAAPPSGDAAVATCTPASGTSLDLQLVAQGLADPLLVTAPAGDARLFVLEQDGRIRIVKDGSLLPTPFLDIRGPVLAGGERGLLGLAFHPDYATNGRFFVNYTADSPAGDTVVAEYATSANPDIADTTEKRLLTVDQPFSNHNGGMITFGPDGFLYIGMGDGGSGGDPMGNGQNNTTRLGAMLRIDVDSGDPFGIPAGNPFVGGAGDDAIWAIGLRNPWRFSFDRSSGDLYIADVGQNQHEEVNVVTTDNGGINYGWNTMEGNFCFNPSTGCDQTGIQLPVVDYTHGGGRCSITGGYVYRGSCIPDIDGWYFYADFCTDQVWKIEFPGNTTPVEISTDLGTNVLSGISSFGQDALGELYITSFNGRVYKIVPAGT